MVAGARGVLPMARQLSPFTAEGCLLQIPEIQAEGLHPQQGQRVNAVGRRPQAMPDGDLGINAYVPSLRWEIWKTLHTISELPRQDWAPAVHCVKQPVKYFHSVDRLDFLPSPLSFPHLPTSVSWDTAICSNQGNHLPSTPCLRLCS